MTSSRDNKEIAKEILTILNDAKNDNPIPKLLELEKKHPSDIGIMQAISQLYLRENKNSEALAYINKAYEISPKNYAINYNLGKTYQKFRKFDEAIKFYKNSIKYNKKFLQGYNILGDIYFNKKDLNQSLDYYKKSFEIDKTNKNTFAIMRLADILTKLSISEKNNDRLKEAKVYYEILYKITPDNQSVIKNLININYHLRLYKEANEIEKKVYGFFIFDKNLDRILIEF